MTMTAEVSEDQTEVVVIWETLLPEVGRYKLSLTESDDYAYIYNRRKTVWIPIHPIHLPACVRALLYEEARKLPLWLVIQAKRMEASQKGVEATIRRKEELRAEIKDLMDQGDAAAGYDPLVAEDVKTRLEELRKKLKFLEDNFNVPEGD